MNACFATSAAEIRASLARGRHEPSAFRAALLAVPPPARDAWVDLVLDLNEIPDDGPALPAGCVPYLPCPVDALLRVVDRAPVQRSDVFVDLGAGVGRAAALVHLLSGAATIGVEIQPALCRAANRLAARLSLASASLASVSPASTSRMRMSFVEGDATQLARLMTIGSVFFLYCPFSGDRVARVLDDLEAIARTRPICMCAVDLPLPPRPWLMRASSLTDDRGDLEIYRSTFTGAAMKD